MLVVLVAIGVDTLLRPLLDAALSRAEERAADAYAADLGVGPELADALRQLDPCRAGSILGRAVASHPPPPPASRR